MRMRRKIGMILLVAVVIALNGCGNIVDSVALVNVPKLSNEKHQNLKETLEQLLPNGFEYATPKYSEPKQSIFTEDMNGDGVMEGIVLYRDTIENKPVHIMVLHEKNGVWSKVSDISTNLSYLDYFKINDLDQNGRKELIIGTGITVLDEKRQFQVYEFNNNQLFTKVDDSYQWIDVNDYNGDKKPEILLLSGEVGSSQKATLYQYDSGKLKKLSEVKLNPDAHHENIVNGKLADGNNAVFIDSGVGAHSMLTEIVAFDKGKLVLVGDEFDGVLLKEYPLYSKDINKDGVIEVGGMYIPKGYEDAAMAEIPFIDTYNDYKLDGTKQTIAQRYSNGMYHFFINIPKEWFDNVTIKNLKNGIELLSADKQESLFQVNWDKKEQYNGEGTKLGESKSTVFYIMSKKDMPISINNFHLTGEDLK